MARSGRPGGVAVTGEGMLDQHGVVAARGWVAPGLVRNRDGPERTAPVQAEPSLAEQIDEPPVPDYLPWRPDARGQQAHVG